jgi:oxalate---CoA ligase
LSTLGRGGAVVIPPRFSASVFWKHVKQYAVTWYSAVPTIHQILLSRADQHPDEERPPLRFIRSCSSALAPSTLQQLEAKFGAPVIEAYGMTEAAHQMASNPLPCDGDRRPSSVGRATGLAIAILSPDGGNFLPDKAVGEVCIRGPNVTRGYRNNPAANADNFTADGWFRTGDQGFLDAGYLTLTVCSVPPPPPPPPPSIMATVEE